MATKDSASIGTWPTPERPVRITLPAEVAFDLGKLGKVLGSLAERLGCRACLSGADCTFRLERDFVVNPATLHVHSIAGGGVIIDG